MGAVAHKRYRICLCIDELLVLMTIFIYDSAVTTDAVTFLTMYWFLVIAGILIILLIPQMNRTYDFRGEPGSWAMLMDRFCCIPTHLDNITSPRHWIREISYLTASAIDFIVRILVIGMLFSYRSASLSTLTVMLIYLDQLLYLGGCLIYAFSLLDDQDLLRNLMEWFDFIIGRDRMQGYHHVYPLGYQFSARPGAMLLTLPLAYSLLYMIQIISVTVIGLFLILNKTDHIITHCFADNINQFYTRIILLALDLPIGMITACSLPIVFHFEDSPRSVFFYRLGSLLAIIIMATQIICKMVLIPLTYIQVAASDYSDHTCGSDYWFSVVVDSALLFNLVVFIFCHGLWSAAVMMFKEYIGNAPAVWYSLIGCCVGQSFRLPQTLHTDDQSGAMFSYEMLSYSIYVILFSPWEFIGLCVYCIDASTTDRVKIIYLYIIAMTNAFVPFIQALESCRAVLILRYPWWSLALLVFGGPIIFTITSVCGIYLTKDDIGKNWLSAIFIAAIIRGFGVVQWIYYYAINTCSKLIDISRENNYDNNASINHHTENPIILGFEDQLPRDLEQRRRYLRVMVQRSIGFGQIQTEFLLFCKNELRNLNFNARRGILLLTFKPNEPARHGGDTTIDDGCSDKDAATIATLLRRLHAIEPYLWRHIVKYL